MKLIGYCLAASAAIFGTIRYFAGPAPKTMTKEWQEMTNEYLKVRTIVASLLLPGLNKMLIGCIITGTKDGSHHGCFFRGIRGSWHGPEQAWSEEQEGRRVNRRDMSSCISAHIVISRKIVNDIGQLVFVYANVSVPPISQSIGWFDLCQ